MLDAMLPPKQREDKISDTQSFSVVDEFGLPKVNMPSRLYQVGKEYDLNDLESDAEFQKRANRFLESIGEEDDIFEYMRDSDFNLYSAMDRYNKSGKFTEEQKADYAYLRTAFDGANVGSADQWLELIKDGTVDMITDPTIILAALFTPFTGGGSLAGRAVVGKQAINGIKLLGKANAKELTKKELTKAIADGTLEQAAKNATKVAGSLGSLEVGGWMGLHNHANQNIELNTGLRKVYSNKELATSIGLGAVLGGTVGAAGQAWSNFSNPVLKIGSDKLTPESNAIRLGASKLFENTLARLFLGNASQLKSLEQQGIQQAKILRNIIDHDSQLGIGVRNSKKVDWSFPELLNERRGRYMFDLDEGLWRNLKEIAPDGTLPEKDSLAIVRYLRGNEKAINKSSKEVKQAAKDIRKWLDSIAKDAEEAGFGDIRIENYFPREWDRTAINSNKEEFTALLTKDLFGNRPTNKQKAEASSIVEGMLNLNNQLYQSHSNLLTHRRKLELLDDNVYEKFLSNDLVTVLANYGLNAANTIQTKITWLGGQKPKSQVRKAIDLEQKEVLVYEGLKKTNRDLFEETWVKPLEDEMIEAGLPALTTRQREDLIKTFESVTGAVTYYRGQITQGAYDSLKLANSLAYLPLATVSSLSEGLISATRPGTKATNNFLYQLETGLQFLTSDMKSVLTGRRGLSDIEANRDANRVFIAVDDVQVDKTNRLAGEGLQTGWAKNLARNYFKLNTLLSWTKNVELAAFRTGKDLVEDSLNGLKAMEDAGVKIFDDVDTFLTSAKGKDKDIIAKLDGLEGTYTGRGNLYKRANYLKETLNDLGIDPKEGLDWVKRGSNVEERFYTRDMAMAGGRFSRSVILPTSREFSKVPRFMTNPRYDVLTQFLRYPTAFSNTVIKNYVRDTLNNPAMSAPGFGAFVVGATAIARGTNYWRSSPEMQNIYDQYARKPATTTPGKVFDTFIARSAEENLRAFQRVGLLGQYEWIQRAKDAYMITGNVPSAVASAFGGPVVGDLTGMGMYNRGIFEVLARKTPLIGTRQIQKKYLDIDPYEGIIESAKELDKEANEKLTELFSLLPGRDRYAEGGLVSIDEGLLSAYKKKYGFTDEQIQKFRDHAEKVGYVESNNIDDRLQIDGGPGRGYFQYEIGENQGASTARNRLLALTDENSPHYLVSLSPEYRKMLGNKGGESIDFSTLPRDLQHALFYADKIRDPGTDMRGFLSNKGLTDNDFWYRHHYRGDDLTKANLLNKRIEDRTVLLPKPKK